MDALNLEVHQGDIFGFVGPNGAGKTTTIRMIAGLLEPDGGEARVLGTSVQKSPERVKRMIGYMPDYFGVYPDLRTWEYLDFFSACYQIEEKRRAQLIDELLELVELSHRRDDMVDKLSRGMKQRLSLARTLIHDPQVLLLDEPASGLDPRARIEIRALLVELAKMGKTIFFSTHILSDVSEICTRVGILEAGSLVACGEIGDLLKLNHRLKMVKITLLEKAADAIVILEGIEGVRKVEQVSEDGDEDLARLKVEFEGDERAMYRMLAKLIRSDVPVVHFSEEEQDLEDVFLTATKGLVS